MIRNLIKSIDKKEWRFILIITIFIILLTTLPYLYGWYQTPPNHTYTGLHSLTPGDVHVYFSWMEQVKQGHFIFEDLYTSEPQGRVLLNSFWSLQGLIAKYTGLSNYLVFQLSRIILIPFFLFILYLISVYFWTDKLWRKISFLFFSFASGLGVTISAFLSDNIYNKGWYNWPLDMWAPEGNNLLTMFQSPHLILSTALLILILFLTFFAFEKDKLKYSVTAGILALILFQFHPFHVPTIFGVLSVYILIQILINLKDFKHKKEIWFSYLKHFLILIVLSFPSIFYWSLLQQYDFVTQLRTYQNICLTPSLWVTIMSYGFIIFLALYASYRLIKTKKITNQKLFIIIWFITQFLLLYSPLPFQRRIMQGLQIPMIILCVIGLHFLYQYLKIKLPPKKFNFFINNKWLLIILFILLFTPSHIYNWIREIAVFAEVYPQLYVHNDKVAGYQWLKQNTPEGTVILTDLYNGNLIPGRIGRKVFIGHGVETLFFDSKVYKMAWFYAINNLDDKKQRFLKNNNIDYVFYSNNEDHLGAFQPQDKDYLKKVFDQGEAQIYKVK